MNNRFVQNIVLVLFSIVSSFQCQSVNKEMEIDDFIAFSYVSAKRADVYRNTFESIRVYFNVKNNSQDTLWLEGDSRASLNCRILLELEAIDSTKDKTTDWNFNASCKLHTIPPGGSKMLYVVIPIKSDVLFKSLTITFGNIVHYKKARTAKFINAPKFKGYISTIQGHFVVTGWENLNIRISRLFLKEDERTDNCLEI
ncbi:MAG: hypothetical protein IT219_11450 [Bacteroidales bacterium]|nr:hypothetical protein [Bacteroidales bacterium]